MTDIDRANRSVQMGMAWHELIAAIPDDVLVKLTLRQRTGQWFATVSVGEGRQRRDFNATGTSEAEALRGCVESLR